MRDSERRTAIFRERETYIEGKRKIKREIKKIVWIMDMSIPFTVER